MNSNNTIYPVIKEIYNCNVDYKERIYKIECNYTGLTDILKTLIKLKIYKDQTLYMEFKDMKVILRITRNKFTVLLNIDDTNVNQDLDADVFKEFMKQYNYPIMDIKLQQCKPSGNTGN